ncbi:hypothetical protein Tco_1372049 [Tanacetum coccineum]
MIGAPESRNKNKCCDFHGDKGHNIDDCLHLKRQIKEAVRSGKLAHLVKEIKQGSNKASTSKSGKKTEASQKEKGTSIFMVQSWGRNVHLRSVVHTPPQLNISFPPLSNMDIKDHPIVIYAEIGRHDIHKMYVDDGSASEILYEHCFLRMKPEKAPGIQALGAVPSTAHGKIKFPTRAKVATIKIERAKSLEIQMVRQADVPTPKPVESVKVAINPEHPEQTVMISGNLSIEGKKTVCEVLKANLDIFAWKLVDMTGVPRTLAEHKLGIKENTTPVRQKKRGQAPERSKFIVEEVQKLVEAWIMREVTYHSWISNPVLVKKHDGE